MLAENDRATTLIKGAGDGRQAAPRSVALAGGGSYEFPVDGGDLPVRLGDPFSRMKPAEAPLTCKRQYQMGSRRLKTDPASHLLSEASRHEPRL